MNYRNSPRELPQKQTGNNSTCEKQINTKSFDSRLGLYAIVYGILTLIIISLVILPAINQQDILSSHNRLTPTIFIPQSASNPMLTVNGNSGFDTHWGYESASNTKFLIPGVYESVIIINVTTYNIRIAGCTFPSSPSDTDINITYCTTWITIGNSTASNTFSGGNIAISIKNCTNAVITYNNIYNLNQCGIIVSNPGVSGTYWICSNTINNLNNADALGIAVTNNSITGLHVNGNTISSFLGGNSTGIWWQGNASEIVGNTISHITTGICITQMASLVNITGNLISYTGTALELGANLPGNPIIPNTFISRNMITGNWLYDGCIGLYLGDYAVTNVIYQNYIHDNTQAGMILDTGSNNNEIEENEIWADGIGVSLINGASGNILENNIIYQNTGYGVICDSNSYQNSIFDNDFVANNVGGSQAYDGYYPVSNLFQSAYSGNFWDESRASSYQIDGPVHNYDSHPHQTLINSNTCLRFITRPVITSSSGMIVSGSSNVINWLPAQSDYLPYYNSLNLLYKFENPHDVFDSNDLQNGTIYGNPMWFSGIGYNGSGAFNFTGSNTQYLGIPDISGDRITASLSFGAWVNVNAFSGFSPPTTHECGGILWKNNEYGLRTEGNGSFAAYIWDASTNTWREAALAGYQPHVWYYVMGTISGNTLTLSVSDNRSTSISFGAILPTNNPLVIGSQSDAALGSPQYAGFEGVIDDVAIYGTALTPIQIQQIYSPTNYITYNVGLNSNGNVAGGINSTECNLDTTTLSDGNYTLIVQAVYYNPPDYCVESSSIPITIHNHMMTPPINLTVSTTQGVVCNSQIISWVVATNPYPITYEVDLSVDGGTTYSQVLGTGLTSNSLTWDTRTFADGSSYRLRVIASDAFGASSMCIQANFFSINNSPTFTTIPQGSNIPFGTTPPILEWKVYDSVATTPNYSIFCNGSMIFQGEYTVSPSPNFFTILYQPVNNLSVGDYNYTCVINNGHSAPVTSSMILIDILPIAPIITTASPNSISIKYQQSSLLIWNATDITATNISTYWILMNGNVVSTGSWILNSTIIYSLISSLAVNVAGENYSFTPIIFNGYFNTTGPAITVQVIPAVILSLDLSVFKLILVTIGLIAVVGMYILTKFQVLGHDLAKGDLAAAKKRKIAIGPYVSGAAGFIAYYLASQFPPVGIAMFQFSLGYEVYAIAVALITYGTLRLLTIQRHSAQNSNQFGTHVKDPSTSLTNEKHYNKLQHAQEVKNLSPNDVKEPIRPRPTAFQTLSNTIKIGKSSKTTEEDNGWN